MATVGYVTTAEALAYIQSHFPSTNAARVRWEALSDNDQGVFLLQSYEAIERLPYTGRKYNPGQTSMFPRAFMTEVPVDVKWAQIENALALSDEELSGEQKFYSKLRLAGIKQYSIGNVSETFGSQSQSGSTIAEGIVSEKALKYLMRYISGGYEICSENTSQWTALLRGWQ